MASPTTTAPALRYTTVIGGYADVISPIFKNNMKRHGLDVQHHIEGTKARGNLVIPEATQVIFLMTDMLNHSTSRSAVEYGGAHNIPVVSGTRKWSGTKLSLERFGFPELPPTADVVADTATPDVPPATETAPAPTPASSPSEAVEVAPTPPPTRLHLLLEAFVEDPSLGNTEVQARLMRHPNYASAAMDNRAIAQARNLLGITRTCGQTPAGRVFVTRVQETIFRATVRLRGLQPDWAQLTPYFASGGVASGGGLLSEEEPPVRPPLATLLPPIAQPTPMAPLFSERPADAPAPAPVSPPSASPASPLGADVDLLTLLGMLKEKMAEHRLVSLSVRDGKVSFEQMQIVSGELTL